VQLIACANVANLLLARAGVREREMGIRAALGAGRWRLVRQLMIESLMLSAAGTVCAMVTAWWTVRALKSTMPDTVPRVSDIALDARVLAAAVGLSLVTAILFGSVPALQSSKPDLSNALKQAGRSTAGGVRRRLRGALVVTELALAVVLLVGAALFIGSFFAVVQIDPGFNPDRVLTAQVSPAIDSRTSPSDSAPAFAEIVDRIGRIPGVARASMVAGGAPLSGNVAMTTITIPGTPLDMRAGELITVRQITPDYHAALTIPLRDGRLFSAADGSGAPPVVIISESAARKYFPAQSAVGRTVTIGGDRTVVGVVADVRQTSLEMEPRPDAYIPMAQARVSGAELIVRTSVEPYAVLPAVKAAVYSVLPDVPLRNIGTLEESMAKRLAERRLSMLLLALFGLLGIAIAAVGIYGVMAYLVSQRTREIGVRIALGATRSSVVLTVLRDAAAMVAAGLGIGGIAAWYLSAASKAFLFRVEPTDPRAFAAAVASLLLAALAASVIPARRAANVDPMVALRAE
jgi:putative ABC transport system permease protein